MMLHQGCCFSGPCVLARSKLLLRLTDGPPSSSFKILLSMFREACEIETHRGEAIRTVLPVSRPEFALQLLPFRSRVLCQASDNTYQIVFPRTKRISNQASNYNTLSLWCTSGLLRDIERIVTDRNAPTATTLSVSAHSTSYFHHRVAPL